MEHDISNLKLGTKIILIHRLYDASTGITIATSEDENYLRELLEDMKSCHTKDS